MEIPISIGAYTNREIHAICALRSPLSSQAVRTTARVARDRMIAIPVLDFGMTSGSSRVGRGRAASAASMARDLLDLGFSSLHLQSGAGPAPDTSIFELEEVVRDSHARVQVGRLSSTSDIEQLLRAGADAVVVG